MKGRIGGRLARLRAAVAGSAWSLALRLQLLTWRTEVHGLEHLDDRLAAGRPTLVVFWHGRYTPLFALLRGRRAVVFTSRSFRGDVIAGICRRFGYRPVQLEDHGGDRSYERMRESLREAALCGIAVDGPLGPYHSVKRGPVQLASELGWPVVPVTFAAERSRVDRGRWDRMEVPRLFTRVVFVMGEARSVPPDLDPEGVAEECARLGRRLEELDRRAVEELSRGGGPPARAS